MIFYLDIEWLKTRTLAYVFVNVDNLMDTATDCATRNTEPGEKIMVLKEDFGSLIHYRTVEDTDSKSWCWCPSAITLYGQCTCQISSGLEQS